MNNKIFQVLKQMFGGRSEEKPQTVLHSTSMNTTVQREDTHTLDPHDLLVIAGKSSLSITSDRRIGGRLNFIDYDPCSGSTRDCLNEMKKVLEENLEEAYDAVLIPIEANRYLLNMADNIDRSACDEVSEYYKKFIDDKLDVFYPIIKMFVEMNSQTKDIGIIAYFGGRTSVGLSHLSKLLSNDGFRCIIEGSKFPFAGKHKEHLFDSIVSKCSGDYEELENSTRVNSNMKLVEYDETIISAMEERLNIRIHGEINSTCTVGILSS